MLDRVREAERRAGRGQGVVKLLPVTKGQPQEVVTSAVQLGLQELGENYLQECLRKERELEGVAGERVSWHLLGHLQRNKVRRATQLFAVLESVDSLELARLISSARDGAPPLPVLLEVELTGLPGRTGFRAEVLERELEQLLALPGIAVQGLMTVAAPGRPEAAFSTCRELAERLGRQGHRPLPTLSMGMSGDFEQAISEGSTEIRIGSLLFGERSTP
ncbi:MAG: YggS family pyridoxal phosphate-dependent enzyme [Candidatus Dormibacteria bacterium]